MRHRKKHENGIYCMVSVDSRSFCVGLRFLFDRLGVQFSSIELFGLFLFGVFVGEVTCRDVATGSKAGAVLPGPVS